MPIESVVFRQINLEDDPFSSDVIKLMLESQYAYHGVETDKDQYLARDLNSRVLKDHNYGLIIDNKLSGIGSIGLLEGFDDLAMINRFYIPKESRGQGFGTFVLDELEDISRRMGKSINLVVSTEETRSYYTKRGYQPALDSKASQGILILSKNNKNIKESA